jgi:hypothetical protein
VQHLTPDMLESAYRLLNTTLPFRRWDLPHPDKVEFRVIAARDRFAHHRAYADGEGHEIAVSAAMVKTPELLVKSMAHEIVHMRQDQLGMRDIHGRGFKSLAKLVCRRHGWDLSTF